ncbi:MAG: endonuclease III [Planctomycetes bacterium]|jgi:endonuclease-3|nr:endonuclease III [Planctomycetota bacterium]MCP4838090.1 endonuclease III [Planctomycetota bacterium]
MKPAKATSAQKSRAMRLYRALEEAWPQATCELTWNSPHELLIATILSAQSTDVAVNAATPALFKAFPTPEAFAAAEPTDVEPLIATIGLFRNKARSVVESMRRVVDVYGGKVPDSMEELVTLRGVARKTANVVLGNAFGVQEGVVVDTHVMRLSWRFGLTEHEGKSDRIERDLMARFPRDRWTMLSHLLVFHGRYACKARNCTCGEHSVCRRYRVSGRCTCAEAP